LYLPDAFLVPLDAIVAAFAAELRRRIRRLAVRSLGRFGGGGGAKTPFDTYAAPEARLYSRVMSTARPYANALEQLRAAGLRPTRQRLALARLLFERGDRHVTAEQLHGEALAAAVPVSLATVYNTLHQFVGAGLLREVVVNPGRSYFDTNVSDHHHFFLEESGQLVDIPGGGIGVTNMPVPPQGTAIRRVDVIIRLERAPS
jgi:Fur family iron response transcriptional regulator